MERQKQVLELYCARQGWTFEVIAFIESKIRPMEANGEDAADGEADDE